MAVKFSLEERPGGPNVSGLERGLWMLPDGSHVGDLDMWVQAWANAGYAYCLNGGVGSTVITFAGAYDADAPDAFVHVPYGVVILPTYIEVIFEAVGTESTMEIIALASPSGDLTVTGTAATPRNMRMGGPTSACTAAVAVDAAGLIDPNVVGAIEFWKYQRPLTDTVATTENDRLPLVFPWSYKTHGIAPLIDGSGTTGTGDARGASLAVYAASQAGTGFITLHWLEWPAEIARVLFG